MNSSRIPPAEIEVQPRTTELSERRYIYNGESAKQKQEFNQRGNRPVKYRRRSPFNIIASIFLLSMLIVFYVWNKITVNRLVVELNDLRTQLKNVENANTFIEAEINRKKSLERIQKIATEKLGMTYPKEQPIWFDVDADRIEQLTK